MIRSVAVVVLILALCSCDQAGRHDIEKQMKIIHECIDAHLPSKAAVSEIPGGVVRYCEQLAGEESRIP